MLLFATAFSQYINWSKIKSYVCKECKLYPSTNVRPALIRAFIIQESSFNIQAISQDGCYGLMQINTNLMNDVNKVLKLKDLSVLIKDDLFVPEINIKYGIWYFAKCLERTKNLEWAITKYNHGVNSQKKTSQYAKNILKGYEKFKCRK